MMGVINEDNRPNVFKKMIDELGITNAIKMAGGDYYAIEPYLKEIDKVNYIKEKVNDLTEWIGGGVGLVEIDEEPIHYDEDENELKQIEYLNTNSVTVDVYDADMNGHLGDYNIPYESLPSQILDEIFRMLLDK
jgi:isopentenyldiphosphate isomerase